MSSRHGFRHIAPTDPLLQLHMLGWQSQSRHFDRVGAVPAEDALQSGAPCGHLCDRNLHVRRPSPERRDGSAITDNPEQWIVRFDGRGLVRQGRLLGTLRISEGGSTSPRMKIFDAEDGSHRTSLAEGAQAFTLRLVFAVVDVAILAFFLLGPYLRSGPSYLIIDYAIAVWIAAEMAVRAVAAPSVRDWIRRPMTWIDFVVLATLLLPGLLFNFAFLRIMQFWAIGRSPLLKEGLRQDRLCPPPRRRQSGDQPARVSLHGDGIRLYVLLLQQGGRRRIRRCALLHGGDRDNDGIRRHHAPGNARQAHFRCER